MTVWRRLREGIRRAADPEKRAARKRPEGIRGKSGREGLFAATEGEKDSMNILLFTTESCSSCDKVKAFLKELPTEMETEEGACSVNIQELSVMEEEERRLSAAAV